MRQLIACLSLVVLSWGCSDNGLLLSPSTPSHLFVPGSRSASVDSGNWTPWMFHQWQPELGQALALDTTADAIVEAGDVCVANLRQTWDWRVSCRRFVVSVSANGWLDAFLRWDASAAGFDPSLSGDVVLVAPDGRFTASDWQHVEEHAFARVEPGNYGVLVMSYVPADLPFQIRLAFRSN